MTSHVVNRLSLATALSVVCLCSACSQVGKTQTQNPEAITEIGNAYLKATMALNRAPKDAEELKPYLSAGQDIQKLLVSPNDGQPLVILWGTDPRKGMDLKPLVIGYEKQGQSGVRCVFTAMGVMLMENAEFAAANFPPGHKPE